MAKKFEPMSTIEKLIDRIQQMDESDFKYELLDLAKKEKKEKLDLEIKLAKEGAY